ncbi:hypothetical protein C8J57DRAFT_1321316 [Mycena rebaudengoi]|nr:hypothetical protein C8J57DRAFT_1321316 [Mycena rebaudengoi]
MSFASYASQYISRAPAASSASTAQPLFFSFTTDEASQHLELEIDDAADPHLEADDPYLRLDDDEAVSEGSESPPGWLAHQRSPSPPRRNRQLRSPSPPRRPPPRSPTPPPVSLLTSSLLPQRTPSFGLATLGKRRRTPLPDAPFAAAFLAAVSIALLSAFLAPLLLPPSSTPLPLLHTLPLLCALTVLAALLSYTHLLLLRLALRPILLLSALTPPLALLISSILLLLSPLRILALLPLPFFLLTLHRLPNTLHRLSRTPRALGLSTRTLYTRTPLLLAVSPVALLFALIASLPPLALLVRLALVRSWILGTLLAATLVLAWGVLRSAQRAVVAGVVGAWWNAWVPPSSSSSSSTTTDTSLPQSLLTLHHALVSPVLGTLVLCALFGVLHALLDGIAAALRFLPMALPYKVVALFSAHLLDIVGRATERVGGGRVVGVYCALTGGDRGFWAGVKGVRELDGRGPPPALPLPRPWTLALPFALVAYLRAAGDRDVDPSNPGAGYAAALGAALLAGTVCAAVSVFCGGVVRDCADTLYVCVALDRAAGAPRRTGEGRDEVWEGKTSPAHATWKLGSRALQA